MELIELFKEHLEVAKRAMKDVERFQERWAEVRADDRQKSREEQLDEWGYLIAEANFLLASVSRAKTRINLLDIKNLPVSARGTKQAFSTELNDQTSTLRTVVASLTERHRGLRDLFSAENEKAKRMAPLDESFSLNI